MAYFKVLITRDATESAEVIVEAKNIEDAKEKCLTREVASKAEWSINDNDGDVYLGDDSDDAFEEVFEQLVLVDNVGTVYLGFDAEVAKSCYRAWIKTIQDHDYNGRADKHVVWLNGEEIKEEWFGDGEDSKA